MTSSSQVCPNIVNFPDAPRAPDHARHGRSIALPHGAARLCVALVADARMHISDGADQVVLDSAMDGSWLLVSMAPGRSRFTVTFQNEILHRQVEIPAKGAVRFPAAKLAGNYQATAADGPQDFKTGYSANIPESESVLDPLDGERLREALGKDRTSVVATLDEIQRAASDDRVGRELFPILALLVLVAISVETWVANRFYEAAPPPAA